MRRGRRHLGNARHGAPGARRRVVIGADRGRVCALRTGDAAARAPAASPGQPPPLLGLRDRDGPGGGQENWRAATLLRRPEKRKLAIGTLNAGVAAASTAAATRVRAPGESRGDGVGVLPTARRRRIGLFTAGCREQTPFTVPPARPLRVGLHPGRVVRRLDPAARLSSQSRASMTVNRSAVTDLGPSSAPRSRARSRSRRRPAPTPPAAHVRTEAHRRQRTRRRRQDGTPNHSQGSGYSV